MDGHILELVADSVPLVKEFVSRYGRKPNDKEIQTLAFIRMVSLSEEANKKLDTISEQLTVQGKVIGDELIKVQESYGHIASELSAAAKVHEKELGLLRGLAVK